MLKELYEQLTACAQTLAGLVEDAEHMGFDGYADVCIITCSEGVQDDGTFVSVVLTRTVTDGSRSFRRITSFDGGETWVEGPEALS